MQLRNKHLFKVPAHSSNRIKAILSIIINYSQPVLGRLRRTSGTFQRLCVIVRAHSGERLEGTPSSRTSTPLRLLQDAEYTRLHTKSPVFIYLYGICSCDALLALLVAQDDERTTIFVERERTGKGAHGFRVKTVEDSHVFPRFISPTFF